MERLPTHVATADEPIPPLGEQPWDGPDMALAEPINEMLADLARHDDDPDAYSALLLQYCQSVGGYAGLHIERDGEVCLMVGRPCDAQTRHRSRWLEFLGRDLDRVEGRRDALYRVLRRSGMMSDARGTNPRATTTAIRDYIATGGRILVTPQGGVCEGGGMPRAFTHGPDDAAEECVRASKAYFDVRRRWRSDRQIRRAAQMLGRHTENGWIVLEGPKAQPQLAEGV